MKKSLQHILFVTIFLLIGSLSIITNAQSVAVKVNFQTEATNPPSGYIEDYGQPYGLRTGSQQASGQYSYGWIEVATDNPIDLTVNPSGGSTPGSARNRGTSQTDLRLDTLMHMDHPNGIESYWEIEIPNGEYEVTVSVGDSATQGSDSEDFHRINVEGVNVINNYQSSGGSGSATRHTDGTQIVTVSDGRLTVDQNGGGVNTKINYIDIVPTGDALLFDRSAANLTVPVDDTASTQVVLSATSGSPTYVVDLSNKPSWLTSVTTPQPATTGGVNLTINVDMTGQSIGSQLSYTLTATATDYSSAQLDIIIDVISDRLQVNPNDTTPFNNASNVDINTSITANFLNTSGGGLDSGLNVTEAMFRLYPTSVGSSGSIEANRNTTGGGDSISLVPLQPLQELTQYTVEVTDQLIDINGKPALPYSWSFTTGLASGGTIDDVEFEKVSFSGDGGFLSQLAIGPDGRLYAASIGSGVSRWDIAADGTISNRVDLNIPQLSGKAMVGLIFDPQSTAIHPILYATENLGDLGDAANFSGKLIRLVETDLGIDNLNWVYTELVKSLPRSKKDHLSNSLVFGPNGERALYMTQGSISAMGAPDGAWGNRYETVLSSAVLRFDIDALNTYANSNGAYDVRTDPVSSETTARLGFGDPNLLYNPQAPGALVTVFASGIRNAYDLLWHSNNNLYVPTNGSAGGGNSPGTPSTLPIACQNRIDDAANGDYTGPTVPAVNSHPTQRDYLFRVPLQGGTYHGHPNPTRCEWVLNGGNPTSNFDEGEPIGGAKYQVGVLPDRNYAGFAYDFENNKSPNGVIEYKSNTFGGALQGAIIVTRYSQRDDLITLFPDGSNGDIGTDYDGVEIPGFSSFNNPLDLIEDLSNGNIYVSDSNGITLLRPVGSVGTPLPDVVVNEDSLIFDQVTSDNASAPKSVTISNIGTANLIFSPSITGANSGEFNTSSGNVTLTPGQSTTVDVTFDPSSNGPKFATLVLDTNDPDEDPVVVALAGLGKQGLGGGNEPSLQWILDTFQFGITVGDTNTSTNLIDLPGGLTHNDLLGDEINAQLFERAVDEPVTIELLAVYGPTSSNPVVKVGYYTEGNSNSPIELFDVDNSPTSNAQSLLPPINSGTLTFDPGLNNFGFYSEWTFFSNRQLFQGDSLNTFSGSIPHHVRIYELPGEDNAYVVATEEHTDGFDYQDVVFIVRNVRPAISAPDDGGIIRLQNIDWVNFPFSDYPQMEYLNTRLIMNRINSFALHKFHENATLRIHNDSIDEDLTITGLTISDTSEFTLPNNDGTNLPIVIQPGGFYDLTVKFIESSGSKGIRQRTLTINSTDPNEHVVVVDLAGSYMTQPEGSSEITLDQITEAFGFSPDSQGRNLLPLGSDYIARYDEVLSHRWKRADPSKPVYARQLAAFHGCYDGVSLSMTGGGIMSHIGEYCQSLIPSSDSVGNPVEKFFTPSEIFTMTAANYSTDRCEGVANCVGHAMRLWPIYVDGQLVPNTYYLIQDYVGGVTNGCSGGSANCDYNDNIFLITNIEPENTSFDLAVTSVTESADPVAFGDEVLYTFEINNTTLFNSEPGTFTFDVTGDGTLVDAFLGDTPSDTNNEPVLGPIYRINAGGPAVTTPSGDWEATNFFINGRNAGGTSYPVANTTDDVVYLTERSTYMGNFSFSAPVDNGDYTIRLHFNEIYFTGQPGKPAPGPGKRVFDVVLEGNLILDNYDPFLQAGGPLTADVKEFDVTITDGTVSLDFNNAGANNPSISGIEIIGVIEDGTPSDCVNGVCSIPALDGNESFFVSALVSADTPGTITTVGTVAATGDTDANNNILSENTQVFDPSQLPGSITIVKDGVPDSSQEFAFTGDLGEFTLTDFGSNNGSGETLKFNFQLDGAPVPTGYLPDVGEPYGLQSTGYTHGWFALDTQQPIDASGTNATNGAMRDRNRNGIAQELDTLVHLARADAVESGGFLTDIYWELELPNGDYRVTVSVGDESSGSGYDSQHQVRVEGNNVFPVSQQLNASNEYVTGTIDVTITDGRLTVDEGDGFNTKINYITVESLVEDNSITFDNQVPATYQVVETTIANWSLVSVVCDDVNSSYNANTGILNIVLDADEDLTCTFTNAQSGTPVVSVEPSELVFSSLELLTSPAKTVTVTNTGTGVLELSGVSILGGNFGQTSSVINLLAGESTTIDVTFSPPDINDNDPRAYTAQLQVNTNLGNTTVDLYGVANSAYGGSGEPPLADVMSTLGYGFDVGWTQLINNASSPSTSPVAVGDEVLEPLFQKADSGDVTLLPVARYSPSEELPYGYYIPDGSSSPSTIQVGTLQTGVAEAQQIFPPIASGGTTFDPGTDGFGIYVFSNAFGRTNYTEDSLNTDGVDHRARVYPMADRNGTPIENSYLVTFEDASNGDYQDYVFVLSNVEPYVPVIVAHCPPISTLECNEVPVTLPYVLDWANDEGGLVDNLNIGTGFTMVDPPSARIADDGPTSNPNVPGYEPGQLAVNTTAGTLTITSNKGIQYSQPAGSPNSTETNSLINGLGVGVPSDILNIETTITNLDFTSSEGTTNSQQAGLWYGLSEDQYVKLAIVRSGTNQGKVQLLLEDVVNNTTTATAFIDLNSANDAITNLSAQTVNLRLMIDPTLGIVAGYYSLDGGTTEVQLENNVLALPAFFTDGVDHDSDGGTSNISYAGIFATHRRSTTSFPVTFTDFSISEPIVVPNTVLSGTVTLQGRTDHTSAVNIIFYTPNTDSVESLVVIPIDNVGNFELPDLVPGTYDIAVKHPQYLQVIQNVTLIEGDNPVDFGQLLAGDVNNDNIVNGGDFSPLALSFGAALGDTNYNALADFTGDDTVNGSDFSLLSFNFTVAGDNPGIEP